MEKNKNKNNKVKEFFRKEGFYLILFLCLCIIATAGTLAVKRNNNLNNSQNEENEFTLNNENNGSEVIKQNADRVDNTENELAEGEEEIASNDEEEVAASEGIVDVSSGTNTQVSFNNPLDGTISRGYTYPKPQKMADGTSRNIRGIDVNVAVGTEVRAAAEGEVKEVSSNIQEGQFIVIAHANGLYTKYTNLSNDVRVNVGDRVTTDTVIGVVGDTSKIFTNNEFGEHLNIQVRDSEGNDLNPTTYFTFNE